MAEINNFDYVRGGFHRPTRCPTGAKRTEANKRQWFSFGNPLKAAQSLAKKAADKAAEAAYVRRIKREAKQRDKGWK